MEVTEPLVPEYITSMAEVSDTGSVSYFKKMNPLATRV